jgi:hypothetical protein
MSHEFRKLDGVSVTDTQPALKIFCRVIQGEIQQPSGSKVPVGYAASVAITYGDGRLMGHLVQTDRTIDLLAHDIATDIDGKVIEPMRRGVQPSPGKF